jgi:hypothetical protein
MTNPYGWGRGNYEIYERRKKGAKLLFKDENGFH